MTSVTTPRQNDDQQQLRKKAHDYVSNYPDLYRMAWRTAHDILFTRTGRRLDPSIVYWHRFSNAVSSPRTFTGWEHAGRPVETMTLVELVVRRFSPQDQVASDELSSYSGFYTVDAGHGLFNETNEVPLLAQDVLRDFWALDFSAVYQRKIEDFWRLNEKTFCVLAKTEYLAAAGRALRDKQISSSDFELLTGVILGHESDTPTLSVLQGPTQRSVKVSIHWLDIGGIKARDILRIVGEHGQQILYVPGDSRPFQLFSAPRELFDWLKTRLSSAHMRSETCRHFLRSSAEQARVTELDRCVDTLLAHDWETGQGLINQVGETIPGDAFDYLRDVAREDMRADAHALLTSNVELRKRIWMGYLDAFLQVAGNLALLGWPVALAVVGAGTFNLGLNLDQAFTGRTAAQRRAGVLGSICNAVYVAFNLPLLAGPMRAGRRVITSSGHGSFTHQVPPIEDLSNWNGNQVSLEASATTESTGRLRGIHQLANGETWIQLDGLFYRVRFNESLQRWQVIDPQNPFAFASGPAVALDEHGNWRQLARFGLTGGAPLDTPLHATVQSSSSSYGVTGSAFWDHYMLINVYDEKSVAEAAIGRQEAVMDIFRMEPGEEVTTDAEGEDVHIDPWGAKHRVFKTHEAMFHAQSIRLYTDDGAIYNQYLRTGTVFEYSEQPGMATVAEQVEDIKRFVEDVSTLGFNNDVTLYRGGSGERGTSGLFFRSGDVSVGDVLVNTDVTSFSENPYQARTFASSQAGNNAAAVSAPLTFDDTSVVFELPAGQYLKATPIAPFSSNPEEAETLFLPGCYFRIDQLDEVQGAFYRFMRVRISEIPAPVAGRKLLEMRTGEAFSRERYAARLGLAGKSLVGVFFPEALSGL